MVDNISKKISSQFHDYEPLRGAAGTTAADFVLPADHAPSRPDAVFS